MRAMWIWIGATVALAAGALAGACESSGGGSDCFPPEHGPNGPSCTSFDVGLICPVDLASWYTCTCTAGGPDAGADAGNGATQTWVCMPTGGGSGGGGSGGSTGSGGSPADASAD